MSSSKNQAFWIGSRAAGAIFRDAQAFEERNLGFQRLYKAMQDTAKRHLQNNPQECIFEATLDDERWKSALVSDIFIRNLATNWKQDFRCTACLDFMHTWGALVCVDRVTGDLVPLFWDATNVPPLFKHAVAAIANRLKEAYIQDRFYKPPPRGVIGVSRSTKGFRHMCFDFNGIWEGTAQGRHSAARAPAPTRELASMLERVLTENTQDVVDCAAYLLLEDMLTKIMEKGERCRRHLAWYFAAKSFVGCIGSLCHGAIGELLNWVKTGVPIDRIRAEWQRIAGPHNYMRPTAAERLFEELGLTQDDMRRAYLTPEQTSDSAFLYRAPITPTPALGVFSEIVLQEVSAKGVNPDQGDIDGLSPTATTFTKFVNDVLPTTRKLEYKLPEHDWIFFFITGLPNSAPLMQWHDADNLASWYVVRNIPPVGKHRLAAGWTAVPYIVAFPNMWPNLAALTPSETMADRTRHIYGSLPSNDTFASFKHKHNGICYLVGLNGAENETTTLCLFPEFLKTEFHGVRSMIEAYSKQGQVERQEAGKEAVAGIRIKMSEKGLSGDVFRVTDWKGRVEMYKLVLWE